MLQRTRQAVSSTFADSNGSLEKGNSACIFHSCKNTRGLVCEPASWKKEMFRDGNTRGNKTNSTSHQEYLGTDMFYDIYFYIRSTDVVHHYKCFLSNFQEKKKRIGISYTWDIHENEKQGWIRNVSSCNMDQSLCQVWPFQRPLIKEPK